MVLKHRKCTHYILTYRNRAVIGYSLCCHTFNMFNFIRLTRYQRVTNRTLSHWAPSRNKGISRYTATNKSRSLQNWPRSPRFISGRTYNCFTIDLQMHIHIQSGLLQNWPKISEVFNIYEYLKISKKVIFRVQLLAFIKIDFKSSRAVVLKIYTKTREECVTNLEFRIPTPKLSLTGRWYRLPQQD